jgi:integrase
MNNLTRLEPCRQGFRVRLRYGKGLRDRFIIRIADAAQAQRRADAMQRMATQLGSSGHAEHVPLMLAKAGEADEARFQQIQKSAEALCAGTKRVKREAPSAKTFAQLADEWTRGELHKRFPDHVRRKRTAADDGARLERLCKTIGDVPLVSFSLADAERAMAALPAGLKAPTRRQYGQLIAKVLKLAVYPCKLLDRSPLPVGFLPRAKSKLAKSFLYPSEDAALMRCTAVPLALRLFYGMLAREGMRAGEARALTWDDLDLERGALRLDRNKTDDPRAWALDPGVVRALVAYRDLVGADASDRVFQELMGGGHPAGAFRQHLQLAGVTRRELFERTPERLAMRVHDLRGTFVTLALASGRSEAWVTDRTGRRR